MRIVVADYSGHPFQVQLSRNLAKRGHQVLHLHFAEFQTPKGKLEAGKDDPENFHCEAVSLGRPFAKYRLLQRVWQEIEVGKRFERRIEAFSPDCVIASNLPLDSLNQVVRGNKRAGYRLVFWQQDIYSTAIARILSQRFGLFGHAIGLYYRVLEQRALKQSNAVVVISRDFLGPLETEFAIPHEKLNVIENWAPLNEITPRPKVNDWSRAHGLHDKEVVLYTGTLGMKHDPAHILAVAEAVKQRPRTVIVVASEGVAADWLKAQTAALKLDNLLVLPFQPYNVYSDVLGSADVLISILDAEAGSYSVPSKVLSYLCAGRAIVLSAPKENLAFSTIAAAGAGLCTPAGDKQQFVGAVKRLLDDPAMRAEAAASGRRYAEQKFDIDRITDKFEVILAPKLDEPVVPGPANGCGGSDQINPKEPAGIP